MTIRTPRTVTISLPPDLARRADEAATSEGRSRSELYREAVRQYLGRRERIEQLFTFGSEAAERSGLREEDVVRAVVESRRAGRQWSSTSAAPPLTGRERDVLRRLAGGATVAEIAADLGTTTSSVKRALERVLSKSSAPTEP